MASSTVTLNVLGLREFAAWMGEMGNKAFDRSQRKAVTFLAKDYRKFKSGRIAQDIDRPTPFTRRAYDFDGALRTGPIYSRAFVREKQSRYLQLVEEGGTRTRRGKNSPLMPKAGFDDRYGGVYGSTGIRDRYLRKGNSPSSFTPSGKPRYKTGDRRYVILRLNSGGGQLFGVFEKRKMGKATTRTRLAAGKSSWRTRMIIWFREQATYRPQLHFQRDARIYARNRFPMLSLRLFNEELRRARGH